VLSTKRLSERRRQMEEEKQMKIKSKETKRFLSLCLALLSSRVAVPLFLMFALHASFPVC
jgi:hypothetical protein